MEGAPPPVAVAPVVDPEALVGDLAAVNAIGQSLVVGIAIFRIRHEPSMPLMSFCRRPCEAITGVSAFMIARHFGIGHGTRMTMNGPWLMTSM